LGIGRGRGGREGGRKEGKGGKEGEGSEGTGREERRRGREREGTPQGLVHTPHVRNPEKYPVLLGRRSRKPFPQIKIYHYTPTGRFVVHIVIGNGAYWAGRAAVRPLFWVM